MGYVMLRRPVALLAGLSVLGCMSERTTGPDAQRAELVSLVSEMSMGDPTTLGTTPGTIIPTFYLTPAAAAATAVGASCIYSATSQSFTCPTLTGNGMTITRSYTLLDAAGHPQSAQDANTVSVRMVTGVSGTLSFPVLPGMPAGVPPTIERHDEMTLSGLNTAQHTLNGTSTFTLTTLASGNVSGGTMSQTSQTSNLVIPASNASGTRWPLSGTITMDMTVTSPSVSGQTFAPLTTHQTMTFNGTNAVTVTYVFGNTTRTCVLTLGVIGTPLCS